MLPIVVGCDLNGCHGSSLGLIQSGCGVAQLPFRWTIRSSFITSVRRFRPIIAIELPHIFDSFAMKGIVLLELVGLDDAQGCVDDSLH